MTLEQALKDAHSPIRNYILPGLTSYLVGDARPDGLTRLFHSTREQQGDVTPHSHRFAFKSLVLQGEVKNRIWLPADPIYERDSSDLFMVSELLYNGHPGEYTQVPKSASAWRYEDHIHRAGDLYSMNASEIHSIFFGRNSYVLIEEGPVISDRSIVLEPLVDHEVIPTLEVADWMFKTDG